MTYEEMVALQEGLFEQIRGIRETKGREYATDRDTLADFKEVAAESGVTPLQCWSVYVKKHQRAIDTFVREGGVKSESIESRVLDVIVYHLLLLGLVEDAQGSEDDGVTDNTEAIRRALGPSAAATVHNDMGVPPVRPEDKHHGLSDPMG